MSGTNASVERKIPPFPWWSLVCAGIAYVATVGTLLLAFQRHERNPPSLFFQIPFSAFMAFFPALWMLVAGAVHRDARERGLNQWLWTTVAFLTPMALGVAVYLGYVLLRPVSAVCPGCGAAVRVASQFCPRCGHRLRRGCPACGRGVDDSDAFCPSCGHSLGS
jgi:RNA polymerase subunit RPABC4/transcription elongation factor Spt4